MRSVLLCFLTTCSLACMAQGRAELCRCDNATVYARYFKLDTTAIADNYRIIIEIENESFDYLYYSRKVKTIPVPSKDPLLPPYLTVNVLNPAQAGKGDTFYIHGGFTSHMSTDTTQIFKITMKRNEHEYNPQ